MVEIVMRKDDTGRFRVVLPDDDRDVLSYLGEVLHGPNWKKHLAKDMGISPQLMTMLTNGKPVGEGGRAISKELRANLGEMILDVEAIESTRHQNRMSVLREVRERFRS